MTVREAVRELANFLCVADESMHLGSGRRWGRRQQLTLSEPLTRELCLAADVTYGWGPDASDWDEEKTPFLEAVYTLVHAEAKS